MGLYHIPNSTTRDKPCQPQELFEQISKSKLSFYNCKAKILIPLIIAISSLSVFLVGYHILTYERAPDQGEVLRIHENLERIIRLTNNGYSGEVTIQGIVSGNIGAGSGMLHIEIVTGRSDVKVFGNDVKFFVRLSEAAYAEAIKRWGCNWRGKTMRFTGTLEGPGGWICAIIVNDGKTVELE